MIQTMINIAEEEGLQVREEEKDEHWRRMMIDKVKGLEVKACTHQQKESIIS